MYIYLDESGDLGFDFLNKKPSRYFVMTALVCKNQQSSQIVLQSVRRTLKNKSRQIGVLNELKGYAINLDVKKYFLKNINSDNNWILYSCILDKKEIASKIAPDINIHRLYNLVVNHLVARINFEAASAILLFIDKSKNRAGIRELDTLLQANIGIKIPLKTSINIYHRSSHDNNGIQAVDLFCWGIFRKYQHADTEWYQLFSDKIVLEEKIKI